ncbi:hypothetical protein [Brevundimonas sp.]|uniref:hypothetical protein n=1 Tax=Brevundimonas sp. TaxID=1871086 RepID=UPI0025ED30DA|nr:hypothetical protein [Brevundimonas sp.]
MSRYLPPGWSDATGVAEPGQLVRDFAMRRQDIKGRCDATGCRRWVTIDPRALESEGLGSVTMTRLAKLWRCNRLEGCQLARRGAPLQVALRLEQIPRRPNTRVRLTCQEKPCTDFRFVPVSDEVRSLRVRGLGDERMTVVGVAKHAKERCPACNGLAWASSAYVIDEHSMDWKVKGEAVWEMKAWLPGLRPLPDELPPESA